jgi:hypothetical protein
MANAEIASRCHGTKSFWNAWQNTACAPLGIAMSPTLLARADKVIE